MIWNHLRHFEHPTQNILPEGLQHFWAEQNLLIPLREIFQSPRFMVQALHTTRVTILILRGDKTNKNEDGEKQGKTGLGVSKAIEKSGDLFG